MTQIIPKVFISHLFGLLLDLGLLFQYVGTSLRYKKFDQWNKILSSIPYTSIITRMRIQLVISTKVELLVPPANANEVQATKVLISDRENNHCQ